MNINQITLQDFPKIFESDQAHLSLEGFKVANTFTNDKGWFVVEFESEAQATMFRLKWS